ncbi:hypothetical protein FIBSPDRAFT_964988 [Athelia psychrophila]|uniref:Uncharacterized protein n=1 Tax=Athelia psychrophila TaxID=1759441 RepID=A0A165X4H5_9AGAM|nr:hypothetical protein FIBSPDRAFT_964988 [Fibularhizoctonia sp. CBS 109695]
MRAHRRLSLRLLRAPCPLCPLGTASSALVQRAPPPPQRVRPPAQRVRPSVNAPPMRALIQHAVSAHSSPTLVQHARSASAP